MADTRGIGFNLAQCATVISLHAQSTVRNTPSFVGEFSVLFSEPIACQILILAMTNCYVIMFDLTSDTI